jgi:hypothetical protein
MTFCIKWFARTMRQTKLLLPALLAGILAGGTIAAHATLDDYDGVITNDMKDGLSPVARLTEPVAIGGTNRAAFNFGNVTGNATFEFILKGDPTPSTGAVCLAVGTNTNSVLRYEQWQNTGVMGFTQLGILDYVFNPSVPSQRGPLHLVYAWNASTRTMKIYLNGLQAGICTDVDNVFAMPTGWGFLGGYQNNADLLYGTYYRVTVYNSLLGDDVIRRHSDSYNDIPSPPTIESFGANPLVLFTPGSATLEWVTHGATAVFLNGAIVPGSSNMTVAPLLTTTYTLTASNLDGAVSAQATVMVNPAPVITRFNASRLFVPVDQTTILSWEVQYGQVFEISPGVGDVTAMTTNGAGSIAVQSSGPLTYTLSVSNPWGTNTAQVQIQSATPASHLVISEFMADDKTTLPDEDKDFSGWIEIHNPTTNSVSLAGYFLTDDATNLMQWAFPATNLAAGDYLVVFASGKDRAVPGRPMHANFKLNNAGEYLALAGPGPTVVHAFAPAYPPQRADISYGLLGDDVTLERYFGVPTPGAPNDETLPRPGKVHFTPSDGTFTNLVTVALSAADTNAEIRYTLDGSLPCMTNGLVYSAPLAFTNTTRLKAVAIAGGQTSHLSGATYLRLAPDLANYTSTLPIMILDDFGAGTILQKGWSGTGAGIKQVPRKTAVWATFDRATNGISALTSTPQMMNLIGIRGRGAYSSTWRQKPFSVEAIDEEGAEEKVAPLDMPAHADWVLYFPDADSDKDPTLLANTFIYELSRNAGRYSVRFRWVEAFINEDGGALKLSDRRGVYAILEKVARGKDRLDFQKLSDDGKSGSWLLDLNRMDPEPENGWPAPNGAKQPWYFHTGGRNRIVESVPNGPVGGDDEPQQSNCYINFDNPSGYNINTAQRAAIEGWFKQFEDVLWNNNLWRDPVLGYRKYLDAVDFADYFILNVLTRNGDGLLLSMYPWKGDDGKLRMGPGWDYNWSAFYISGGATGDLMWRSDQLWYERLFADPDFSQLYIDRWWDYRRGPMSDAAMDAIIDRQVNDITPAKSLLNGMPSTTEWASRVSRMKTWLKQRANWIDSNYVRPPAFATPGGAVTNGFAAVIRGTNGTIYYTLDGTDPRAMGGAVTGGARAYQGPVALSASSVMTARIKNGSSWSGLTTATYAVPQDMSGLVITEIMYNPPVFGNWMGEDLEFLELKNSGSTALNLGLMSFTSGISFTFTNGTFLKPGQFFVLARNTNAFQERYPGVAVNGVYTGRLDNSGEMLELSTFAGNAVLTVTYNDRAPWPQEADGLGYSLVPRSPVFGNSSEGTLWRASAQPWGSPGADDPESAGAPVIVSQTASHKITAFQDYELSVTVEGNGPIYYQWLLNGKLLVGATNAVLRLVNVQPEQGGAYQVVTYNDAGASMSAPIALAVQVPVIIQQQPQGVSTNSGATVAFSVSATGTGTLHYQWRRNGIRLTSATSNTLVLANVQAADAGDYAVVITDDIGAVISRSARLAIWAPPVIVQAPLPQTVAVGGTAVFSVEVTNTATVPLTNRWWVDRTVQCTNVTDRLVDFFVLTNMPAGVRNVSVTVANAASPAGVTTMQVQLTILADGDGDGLPDVVEKAMGFSTNNPADGLADTDGDGMANWQEFVAGMDPANALSFLAVSASPGANGTVVHFNAVSNKTHAVEYRDDLSSGAWTNLADFPARSQNRAESCIDPDLTTNRFYRVKTPARP